MLQLLAWVDDQVSVVALPYGTALGLANSVTLGAADAGVGASAEKAPSKTAVDAVEKAPSKGRSKCTVVMIAFER